MKHREAAGVFAKLAERVGMIPTREIVAVWAGLKTSRIGGTETTIRLVEEAARPLGLATVRSTRKYLGRRDIGKGGWSNKFGGSFPVDSPCGDWLLYIAKSADQAQAAREAEEDGREFDFGGELGIPACCARFYVENQDRAMAKQNDYVPLVLRNTASEAPYDPLLNYVAQYFGYSLISFFPCSFCCPHAKAIAQRSLDVLIEVSPALANDTLRFQRMPVLYTEYRGLYAFEGARFDAATGLLSYCREKIHGTLPTSSSVFRKLLQGDHLELLGKDHVRILSGSEHVAELRGENVSACIF